MAAGFTEHEKEYIIKKLKESANECARRYGLKKTTVDQLVEYAGISKGAFYKFYPSKEMLFFEIVEEWHTMVYSAATEVLEQRKDLTEKDRLAQAFLAAFKSMEDNSLVDFFENDMQYLIRKIPKDILDAHYHSDELHIEKLMEHSGFQFVLPAEVVSGCIKALILTLSHRKDIGSSYNDVLSVMVHSVCDRLIK